MLDIIKQAKFTKSRKIIGNIAGLTIRNYMTSLLSSGAPHVADIYLTKLVRELKFFGDLLNLYFEYFENNNKLTAYIILHPLNPKSLGGACEKKSAHFS